MTNTFKIICITLSLSSTLSFAATYTVKRGDTLANIARKRYGEPVFGPKGTIKKILKQNPNLKMNVALEPGQKINLEATTADYPPEKVPNAKALSPVVPLPRKENKFDTAPFEHAAKQMDMLPRAPIKDKEEAKEEPKEDAHVELIPKKEKHAEEHASAHEAQATEAHGANEGESHHNYFSIIPQYSVITQTAVENATSESFTMHSSPAWGAEFGWDHWWNSSFSTVLTYTALQFTSKETSELTGAKLINKMLHRGELALLNRLAPWVRLGFGMAYGDHVFVAGFPSDAHTLRVTYLNPFANAELTAYENSRYEVLVNLKVAQLPAQSNGGDELLAGTEYFGQVSLMQRFDKFSMIYGIAYSTENQTLSDARESRKEWALKVGALF